MNDSGQNRVFHYAILASLLLHALLLLGFPDLIDRARRAVSFPPPLIARVRCLDHVVLQVGTESVLRAEERRQLDPWIVAEHLGGMPEPAIDRRGIGDEGHAGTGDQRTVFLDETLDADPDRAGGGRCR